ncbi:hypothetical protein Mhypo_03251 [Meiothermus hypogaeus]|uniref:Uncharacterized protein n=1 Tax=Meiothermus hypogaeus TaxID=884155 RepID=A0ABX9MIQ5_9DEIN|nr:hypothetical protein Mhypo_03251 [Meiothermus hypogaeus]
MALSRSSSSLLNSMYRKFPIVKVYRECTYQIRLIRYHSVRINPTEVIRVAEGDTAPWKLSA